MAGRWIFVRWSVQVLYIERAHIHAFLCMVCLFPVESLDRVTNGLGHDEEWAEIDCCTATNFLYYTMNFYGSRCGPSIEHTNVLTILRRTCASVCCQGD
jgi:hypothetical protein